MGRMDEGVFVVLDADEQAAEEGRDGQGDDGHQHDGETEPEHEGVPLPCP